MTSKVETLIMHMRAVEQAVSRDKGPFTLFSLFEREDLSDRWDLVASAAWLEPRRENILTITQAMSRHLEPEELILIARVVPVPADSDFVCDLFRNMVGKAMTSAGGYAVLDWPHTSGEDWMGRGYILTPQNVVEQTHSIGVAA